MQVALFALGDLHLSGAAPKPMDIFGTQWQDHGRRIAEGWCRKVSAADTVIIPGDISWAMGLAEALPDLLWIAGLPGEKVLVRGNHDYWWQSISRVRRALPERMHAIQNSFHPWGDWGLCGSRGWTCPGEDWFDPEKDEKIYRRELQRLEMSLASACRAGYRQIVAALHYPPVNTRREPSGFTELIARYPVVKCVYGHLHGEARASALEGVWQGVEYRLVACDAVDFTPVLVLE